MQCMLNICTDFGTEYDVKFNENKSVALRIGPRFCANHWYLVVDVCNLLTQLSIWEFELLLRTILNALLRMLN